MTAGQQLIVAQARSSIHDMQQVLSCFMEAYNAYWGTCFWGCVLFCAPEIGLLHTVFQESGSFLKDCFLSMKGGLDTHAA